MRNNTPYLRYIASGNHLPNKSFVKAYDCRFFYVLNGKGMLFTEKGDFALRADTLCYYPSGCAYHIRSDEKEPLFFITVNFDFTDTYRQDDGTLRPVPEKAFDKAAERPSYKDEEAVFSSPFSVDGAVFLRNDFLRLSARREKGGPYERALCSSLLKVIILELAEYLSHQEKAAKPALLAAKYVQKHLASPLSVKTVAAHLGYHPYYLGAVFKKSTGESLTAFIHAARIKSAEELLLHTDEPINVIAERCGFTSADGFAAVFKKRNGLSPSAWRREYRMLY